MCLGPGQQVSGLELHPCKLGGGCCAADAPAERCCLQHHITHQLVYQALQKQIYIYILYNISEYASMVPQALAGVRNLAPALARARFVVVDEVDACFQVGG